MKTPTDRAAEVSPRLMVVFVVVGVICRVAQYLSRRSFWEDESFIVLYLKFKTAAQLMGPLADLSPPQAAPPLWLLVQRGMAVTFGAGEFSLRAIPLLCGIAGLLAFAVLARRMLSAVGALIAVAVFALSDRLIWKSAEVKPYGSDALIATLILLAATPREGSRRSALSRLVTAAGIAVVGTWFSYPTILVFAAVSFAMLPGIARPAEGRWRRLAVYAAANLAALASFAVVFMLAASDQEHRALDRYWAEHFADWSRPWMVLPWILRRLFDLSIYAAEWTGFLLLPAAAVAVVVLWRAQQRQRLMFLLGPAAIAIAAACAQGYPFDGRRVSTFLIPPLVLLAGAGFAWLLTRNRSLAAVTVGLLIVPQIYLCAVSLVVPRTRAHIRPAVEYVLANRQPGDVVYTTSFHQVRCYWPENEPPPAYLGDGAKATGRFWVLLGYRPGRSSRELQERLQPAVAVGTQVGEPYLSPGDGGAAYLFQAR